MSKRVTEEEIKKMNELYLVFRTYSGVAKEVGRTPATVKKYIDPNYQREEKKELKFKLIDWTALFEVLTGKKDFNEFTLELEEDERNLNELF